MWVKFSEFAKASVTQPFSKHCAKWIREHVQTSTYTLPFENVIYQVIYRKQLYNKIQELRGNIRVFLRCRPDNEGGLGVVKFPSSEEIIVPSLRGEDTMYDFDKTFDTKATQEMIFVDTMPTIMSVIDGYNVCIIAYGQTGSGTWMFWPYSVRVCICVGLCRRAVP